MNETTIAYIGNKPFIDRLYNTGLSFDVGQVRTLSADVARLFLRHNDLFAVSDSKPTKSKDDRPKDDTADILAEQASKNAQKEQEQNQLQDLYTQIMVMDKNALEQFAKDHYQHDLNKRKSVESLREEVIGLIDQFGVI